MYKKLLLFLIAFCASIMPGSMSAQNRVMQLAKSHKAEPFATLKQQKKQTQSRYDAVTSLRQEKVALPSASMPLSFMQSPLLGQKKAPSLIAPDGTEIIGNLSYDQARSGEYSGLYKFLARPNFTVEQMWLNEDLSAGGGGAYFDGRYHYVYYYNNGYTTMCGYYVYNYEDGVMEEDFTHYNEYTLVSNSGIAYDATTGRGYGQFWNQTLDELEWGYIDYSTVTRTKLADVNVSMWLLAMDNTGQIYGISSAGDLYTIDKETGAETLIGATGFVPYYQQSMAFDQKTNKLYWAAINKEEAALFEVNTTTGVATKISNMPSYQEWLDIYIPAPKAEMGAPDEVSELSVNIDASNPNNVAVSFKMPGTTYGGTIITGQLDYEIRLDGAVVKSGKASVSSTVNENIVVENGIHTIVVVAKNSVGYSPESKHKLFAGYDEPLAVQNVELLFNADKTQATITWDDASSEGVHGGVVDTDNITYKVVAYPSGRLVADNITSTICRDDIVVNGLASYYYTVTAVNHGVEGLPAASNKAVLGEYIVPPFFDDFENSDMYDLYTIISNDGNQQGWQFREEAGNMEAVCSMGYTDQDDWLLTPPIKLEEGKEYTLTFDRACYRMSQYYEMLGVSFGEGTDPTTYTELMPATKIDNIDLEPNEAIKIRPANSGIFHVGFHCTSPKYMFMLRLDNVRISEGVAYNAPDAVKNLTVVPADMGGLSAEIKFKSPVKTLDGDALNSISRIEIERDGELVHSINNPEVGTNLTYTDNVPANGLYEYTVIAYNESGRGVPATASAYIGLDQPEAVAYPNAYDEGDNKVKITWQFPTSVGLHGGYVNVDDLTYNIYRVTSEGQITELLGSVQGGTEITINDDISTGMQEFRRYAIAGMNTSGIGRPVAASLITGEPFALPFTESFSNGGVENPGWWTSWQGGTSMGWYPQGTDANYGDPSYDGDNGCIGWMSEAANEHRWINTGKIDIKSANKPTLFFNYYARPNTPGAIAIEVNKAQRFGVEEDQVSVFNFAELDGTDPEWFEGQVDLSDYKDLDYILLLFHGFTGAGNVGMLLDNIRVLDLNGTDLAVGVTAPANLTVGVPASVKVKVTNHGVNAAEGYVVTLKANGKEVGSITADEALPAGLGEATYNFTYTASVTDGDKVRFEGIVEYDGDENDENNNEFVDVNVTQNSLPWIKDLTGELTDDGEDVVLSWSSLSDAESITVTEDFERYEDFAVDGNIGGGWTFYDGDGLSTYSIGIADHPNMNVPMAWQVFNPYNAGLDMTREGYEELLGAHSGQKYLASFCPDRQADGSVPASDDWLISPELSGDAQTISFYQRAFIPTDGPETYEVYYSSTDTEISSFQRIGDTRQSAVNGWEEVNVDLPQGAKYFAIRKISQDVYMMRIDDITFSVKNTGQYKPVGYNIYCDGQFVDQVDANTTTYTHTEAVHGDHTYNVTVVYADGESRFSNTVSIYVTAIKQVTNNADFANADVVVYTTAGAVVAEGRDAIARLPKGVYVVKNKLTGEIRNITKR